MKRNVDIIKSYQRELNLNTRMVSSKKAYTRKIKHKKGEY